MLLNHQLSAQKKTKTLLFRQKEAPYAQNPARRSQTAQARGYPDSSTSNHLHQFQQWQKTRLPCVQRIQGETASRYQSSNGHGLPRSPASACQYGTPEEKEQKTPTQPARETQQPENIP